MRRIILTILLYFFIFPLFVFAQSDEIFKARVQDIIQEEDVILSDGNHAVQQKILLKGLSGDYLEREVVFDGFGDYDVVKKNIYKEGDKVLVVVNINDQGDKSFYITDYVRGESLFWLFVLFCLFMIIVGRLKGLRSIFSLVITFLVIIKFIIPQILIGGNPVIISLIGSLLILLVVVYFTEGFNRESHIAIVSILSSLIITIFISWFFIELAHLSGLADEETAFLIGIGSSFINFKGLLLAGIIVGTLGVLDDVVISQIVTTRELIKSNSLISKKELFKKSYTVGVSHISSMTNTLFLAYAGVSLPLLILFSSSESAFKSFSDIISNEAIATEIVRTLAGGMGLILAVPISTYLAVRFLKIK